MSNSRVRDKQIKIYVTERERDALKRKSAKVGLTVSEYVRQALVYSRGASITFVDTAALGEAWTELRRQGVNLNQLVKNLNTYGADACDGDEVDRICEELSETYLNVTGALIALRREAEKHKVVIDFERYAKLDDEE